MDEIVLYSTGCPKCAVLEKKLNNKNIPFSVVKDVNKMLEMGLKSAPNLKVGDTILQFADAVKWINEQ